MQCIFLYPLVKEMTDKPSNVTAATNLFFSVYVIGMTCFNECFLFYVITERHYNPKTELIKFVIVNFGKISFSNLFLNYYFVTVPHFSLQMIFCLLKTWKHIFTNMYEN